MSSLEQLFDLESMSYATKFSDSNAQKNHNEAKLCIL